MPDVCEWVRYEEQKKRPLLRGNLSARKLRNLIAAAASPAGKHFVIECFGTDTPQHHSIR